MSTTGQFASQAKNDDNVSRLNEMNPRQLTAMGNQLMAQRRFDDAAAAFQKLREINPRDVNVLNSLGTSLFMAGWQDMAIDCMRQATRAQPSNATFHANLAKMLAVANRCEEALVSIESAMQVHAGTPKPEWRDLAAYCRETLLNA